MLVTLCLSDSAEIVVSLTQGDPVTDESMGRVMVCAVIVRGELDGTTATLALSTLDGSAINTGAACRFKYFCYVASIYRVPG